MVKYPKVIFYLAMIVLIGISAANISLRNRSGAELQTSLKNSDFSIRSRMSACFQNGGRNHCYRDVADTLLSWLSPKEILASFERQESYPEIFSRCHEVTHYVGRAAYAQTKNVPLAYDQCIPVCHGGCYHGVLEEYLKEKNVSLNRIDDATVTQEISTVCGEEKNYNALRIYWECFHGIGHALMFITNSDLVRSLRLCDTLPGQGQRETCYGGAFMENSSSSTSLDHPSKYLNADNPMYPCTILEKKYLNLCYQYQSSYFAEITNWQWEKTIDLCNQVPIAYREGCFHIIGTNQVGYTQDNNQRKHTCDLIANPNFKKFCVSGVASALGGRYVNQPDYMIAFCALVDAQDKEICYRQMDAEIRSWGTDPATHRNICNIISDPGGTGWCFSGEGGMTKAFLR